MYKCAECGRETEAVANSRKEKRCQFCYAVLSDAMLTSETAQELTPGTAQGLTPGTAQGLTPGTAQGLTPGTAQGLIAGSVASESKLPPQEEKAEPALPAKFKRRKKDEHQ